MAIPSDAVLACPLAVGVHDARVAAKGQALLESIALAANLCAVEGAVKVGAAVNAAVDVSDAYPWLVVPAGVAFRRAVLVSGARAAADMRGQGDGRHCQGESEKHDQR